MKSYNLGFLNKLIALLLLTSLSLFASIGKITAVNGQVSIERGGKSIEAKAGVELNQKDTIKSKASSNAQLVFADQTVITVGPNSSFGIDEYINDDKNPSAKFKAGDGAFKAITGKIGKLAPDKFKVETKTATIGIRGTRLIIISAAGVETYACTKGTITAIPKTAPMAPPVSGAPVAPAQQQQQQEPVIIIIKSGQMTTSKGGQIEPPRMYSPTELKQLEKSTETGTKTSASGQPANSQTQTTTTGTQTAVMQEEPKTPVVVLQGSVVEGLIGNILANVNDLKSSAIAEVGTKKLEDILNSLTAEERKIVNEIISSSPSTVISQETASAVADYVSPYMALAKDIDSMSPVGVGQTRTITHAGTTETFTMSYYNDDGEAYAWSRQVNMVDELNNPITKYQYITSLDMVNALKNHISISSQSYADVMIYLPSFSETYPFYASFNGIGFVHDYIDVPLELSKIGKTISAVDASTLVNSFIIRFPFADGYTYSATAFDPVRNRWTMENTDASRLSYLTTFDAIRPLASNPNLYTANLKGLIPSTHTPYGEIVVFETLVPQALSANAPLQNQVFIYTQYGSNGVSDATKLGNNIFVKTGTDSLTFAASNGMFSNQGGSLVQGGSVIAGKIDNTNAIGGLHFDMQTGAQYLTDVVLAHGNDQYLWSGMGGPDYTSDLLAYLIHKNSDSTTDVYKKVASDLSLVKKPTYGWGFAGTGTTIMQADTINGFMSGYETISGKYILKELTLKVSDLAFATNNLLAANDGISGVLDSDRAPGMAIIGSPAMSGSFVSEDIQTLIIKGDSASSKGISINSAAAPFYDMAFASLPDKVSGSTLEYVDDASSWGYWLAREATASTSNVAVGFWVAGIDTAVGVLNSYRTGATVANYAGHVLGNLDSGGIKDTIRLDGGNFINFNVNFGGSNPVQLTGIGFTTVGGTTISGSGITTSSSKIGGVDPSSATIPLNNFQGTASWGASNFQYFGKFFGPEANSMGGNWAGTFNGGSTKGVGVFKAGRTN